MKKEQLLVGGKRGGNKQASKVPRKRGEKIKLFLNSHLLSGGRFRRELKHGCGKPIYIGEDNSVLFLEKNKQIKYIRNRLPGHLPCLTQMSGPLLPPGRRLSERLNWKVSGLKDTSTLRQGYHTENGN